MQKDGLRDRFWEEFDLADMSHEEWEALCDGCGKCCVLKFTDEDSNELYYTSIACRMFNLATCRCKHYEARTKLVKDCIVLTVDNLPEHHDWLPSNCAYRLLYEGRKLFDWHPLISKNPDSVRNSGHSVANLVVPEYEVDIQDIANFVMDEKE